MKFFYALYSINKIISDFFLSYFRPGVGKTTVMREIARVLSDEFQKRVVSTDFLYSIIISFISNHLFSIIGSVLTNACTK